MQGEDEIEEQLIVELVEVRQGIFGLEEPKVKRKRAEEALKIRT